MSYLECTSADKSIAHVFRLGEFVITSNFVISAQFAANLSQTWQYGGRDEILTRKSEHRNSNKFWSFDFGEAENERWWYSKQDDIYCEFEGKIFAKGVPKGL